MNPQDGTEKQEVSQPVSAVLSARPKETSEAAVDPDLAAVVDAWPNLPDAVRVGIVAMVKASAGSKG
jgi:hypothetical protein